MEHQTARMAAIRNRGYQRDGIELCKNSARQKCKRSNETSLKGAPFYDDAYANAFDKYLRSKPEETRPDEWLAFVYCGRPAGDNGSAILQSGRAAFQAEMATIARPLGVLGGKSSALAEIGVKGLESRRNRRLNDNYARNVDEVRSKALSEETCPDEAEHIYNIYI